MQLCQQTAVSGQLPGNFGLEGCSELGRLLAQLCLNIACMSCVGGCRTWRTICCWSTPLSSPARTLQTWRGMTSGKCSLVSAVVQCIPIARVGLGGHISIAGAHLAWPLLLDTSLDVKTAQLHHIDLSSPAFLIAWQTVPQLLPILSSGQAESQHWSDIRSTSCRASPTACTVDPGIQALYDAAECPGA